MATALRNDAPTDPPSWLQRLVHYAVTANVLVSRYTVGLPQLCRRSAAHPSREDFTVAAAIVSRNDNYGGNLRERAAYALSSAMATSDKVLYVDWASPSTDLLHEIRHRLPSSGGGRPTRPRTSSSRTGCR